MGQQPRGIRNNNPGNIRHSSTKWVGEVKGSDPSFKTFSSPAFGIRAMAKLLGNYQRFYGLNTIRKMISRWAPPSENDTAAYIAHVVKGSGIGPDDEVTLDDIPRIVPPMIAMENGQQPYGADVIAKGCRLARVE